MKMMKRMQTIALSVALTSLSTLPVGAFTGVVDPVAVTPDAVTCINYTTGISAPGQLLDAGQFDCSSLDRQQGERIGVVVSGLSGSGVTPPTGQCEVLQESAGTGFTEVGTLAPNQCVTIEGQIDRPFNQQDPTTLDIFRVALTGPTNLSLLLEPGEDVGWGMGIGDPQTGQFTGCEGPSCQAALNTGLVDIVVVAGASARYRLTITAGATGGVAGMAMRSHVALPALELHIPEGVY